MGFADFFRSKKEPTQEEKEALRLELGRRIEKLLPDEKVIGQPFWGLMEVKDGRVNGNYMVLPNESGVSMPLFISKYHAQAFLAHRPSSDQKMYSVRGLNQEQIRLLGKTSEEQKNPLFMIFLYREEGTQWKVRQIDGKTLRSEFVWD